MSGDVPLIIHETASIYNLNHGGAMNRSFSKISLLYIFTAMLLFTGCSRIGIYPSSSEATGFYFDTVISVRIYGEDSQKLLDGCMELARHYEQLLSATREGSDIWNINHSGGSWVSVDQDTLSVLELALDFAQFSEGAVDPTIGGLSRLWNFGSENQGIIPEKAQIERELVHVDYHAVAFREGQVMLKDPQARLDLGFIAKGFIGDKMKEYLLSQGVDSALINLGGNVVALGGRPDGSGFRVGIRDPFDRDGSPLTALEISDKSVVSSGNYERFFEKEGELYHHILSPQSGYPVKSGLAQVTIISPDSARADALSTLCFVQGYEKAASLLENYPDLQAIFVTEDGEIIYENF